MFYGPLKRTSTKIVPSPDLHRNKRTKLPHFPTILALKDAWLDQPLHQPSQVGLCTRSCKTIFSFSPPRSLQKIDRSRSPKGQICKGPLSSSFVLFDLVLWLVLLNDHFRAVRHYFQPSPPLSGETSIIDILVNNGQNGPIFHKETNRHTRHK